LLQILLLDAKRIHKDPPIFLTFRFRFSCFSEANEPIFRFISPPTVFVSLQSERSTGYFVSFRFISHFIFRFFSLLSYRFHFKDIQHVHAVWPCKMDMQHGHDLQHEHAWPVART
jgi:hypothetical protein